MIILERIDFHEKEANPTIKEESLVCDAMIRSRLLYSIESATFHETVKKTLDAFMLQGIRKNLNAKTASTDGEQANKKLFESIQAQISNETEGRKKAFQQRRKR